MLYSPHGTLYSHMTDERYTLLASAARINGEHNKASSYINRAKRYTSIIMECTEQEAGMLSLLLWNEANDW